MKKAYLKNIDLRKEENINFIYNTEEVKIIKLDLDIKHPQISMSSIRSITVEGYLPTSYKDFDLYDDGLIFQEIFLLKGYESVGLKSDKYTLYLTLIKRIY